MNRTLGAALLLACSRGTGAICPGATSVLLRVSLDDGADVPATLRVRVRSGGDTLYEADFPASLPGTIVVYPGRDAATVQIDITGVGGEGADSCGAADLALRAGCQVAADVVLQTCFPEWNDGAPPDGPRDAGPTPDGDAGPQADGAPDMGYGPDMGPPCDPPCTSACLGYLLAPSECVEGSCEPGSLVFCIPYACNLAGTACNTSCTTDFDCASGYACGDGGVCEGAPGAICLSGDDCATGFCIDGVCCDEACAGECEACDVAGSAGACAPIPAGADPGSECVGSSVDCNGACDGAGACDFPTWLDGESALCGPLPCYACDGAGNCDAVAPSDPDCGVCTGGDSCVHFTVDYCDDLGDCGATTAFDQDCCLLGQVCTPSGCVDP